MYDIILTADVQGIVVYILTQHMYNYVHLSLSVCLFVCLSQGVPLRVEIGPRDVRDEKYVVVLRDTGEKQSHDVAKATEMVPQLLHELQERLYDK